MRRERTLILIALLALGSLAVAQQPPPAAPSGQERTTPDEDAVAPMLSEEISDEAVWSEDATNDKSESGFIPSEAISADATIAFPVDI